MGQIRRLSPAPGFGLRCASACDSLRCAVKRLSHMALFGALWTAGACSPACTPPEAQSPQPQVASSGGEGGPNGGAQAVAPMGGAGEMIMEARGVDAAKLTDAQRTSFFQIINTEPAACDKPHSLATSLRDDPGCRDSGVLSQFVADALATGASPADVKEGLEFVADSLKPRTINIQNRPVFGDARAPITVVMFADFECPHCRAEFPEVRKTVAQFHKRAKLVFKHFPLNSHSRAKVAAVAVEAAREQGKFWEMVAKVFEHQTQLEDADLKNYAKQLGLDIAKFEASFSAQRGKARVEEDRADGERINLEGTPAVFVNGRYVNELLFGGTVAGWIDDALRR